MIKLHILPDTMLSKRTSRLLAAAAAVVVISALVITAGCVNSSEEQTPVGTVSHGDITKVADYLYEATIYDYDESKMTAYADFLTERIMNAKLADGIVSLFNKESGSLPAGCSAVHVGDYYGRNLDLGFSENSDIVIHVPAKEGRYASVGVALIVDESWTPEYVEAGLSEEDFTLLPFVTQDGVNEKGVGVNCNYAPVQDLETFTTGTNPGKMDLPLSFIPRFILDNAASAKEAVDLLSECNVYGNMFSFPPSEMHFMICDTTETYIVEFVNNKMNVVKDNVMTNYYQSLPEYTPQACGIERYSTLKAGVDTVTSVDTMDALMQTVQYTKAYNPETTPRWYSEIYGMEVDISSSLAEKEAKLNDASEEAKTTTRKPHNPIWQTMHSSIYDLKNLTLKLHVQEDYKNSYEFRV